MSSMLRRFSPALGFILTFGLAGCGGYGSKVEHGNIEVFYTEGATKEEADKLGAYLAKQPEAAGERRSVQLKKPGGNYQFRMVVKEEFRKDAKTQRALEFEGARISRDVLAGAAVETHICDDRFNTLQTLPPRADMRYGVLVDKIEVFFPEGFDKAEAQSFAKDSATELPGAAVTFKLARRDKTVEVHMAARPELVKDAGLQAELRRRCRDLSTRVFEGAPVEFHLCDELLNVLEIVRP
jgi:hypothetical protein